MKTPQDIIIAPIASEKSYGRMHEKIYQFNVAVDSNKDQIRGAIEKLFSVRVTKVNIINVHPKEKRRGIHKGFTSAWKKAIVAIHPEDSISLFEGMV
ncbi:MAG: 50S ribosomal protein L23 [Candidatus Riflebacteria bacterium]|nr:50S ribosomal protein L23 [Candidatus Riflebacteria bacterium]